MSYFERMKRRIDNRYMDGRLSTGTALRLFRRAFDRYVTMVHCPCCGQLRQRDIEPGWKR